jgi:hypothetical protein
MSAHHDQLHQADQNNEQAYRPPGAQEGVARVYFETFLFHQVAQARPRLGQKFFGQKF